MPPSPSTTSWPAHPADWLAWVGRLAALLIVAWSPFSGGPRVPGLVLALLGLWALLRRRETLLAGEAARRWLILFGLLWLPVLASVPGSVHAQSSLKVAGALPLYGLAGLGLLAVLADPAARGWLQRWLAVVLLVWVADSYVQLAFGVDLLGVPLAQDGRVVGMFGDNLRQALILAALAPVVAWWLAERRMLLATSAYAALLGVVVLSGARLAWLIALLGAAAFLWSERPRVNWPVVAGGLALVVLVAMQSPLVQHKLDQTATLPDAGFQSLDRVLGYRLTIWDTALAMLADRPLTGVGAGAFDEAYPHYARRPDDPFRPDGGAYAGPVYHAHQMYVSVAAESGLFGLAGLVAVVWLGLRWYRRAPGEARRRARPYGVGLAAVAFPLNSQPILYTNWWLPVLVLALGLFLRELEPAPAGGAPP